MDMVRVGLIGCGSMGASLARTVHTLDTAQVVAVADVDGEKVRGIAGELGEGVQVFGDYREMLDLPDVDAVIVASPGYLHEEMVVAAASAGKHTFCEKPMAFTVDACDRMIQAAHGHGVKLMIGQVLRYLPVFNKIKEMVDSGVLGRPFSVTIARIGGGWGASSWRKQKDKVGGVLYEVSVHELDFMRYIAGDVDRVAAFAGNFVQKYVDYEDLVQVLLHFRQGGSGALLAGMSSALGSYDGKILCEKGSLFFNNGWADLRYRLFDGDEVQVSKEDMATEPGVRRELREFVEAVLNDTEPTIPGEEGRKVIEIVQAAYRSAEEEREIVLPL